MSIGRKRYPIALIDVEWELLEGEILQPEPTSEGDRSRTVDMREVIDTTLYPCRNTCQWDMLPRDPVLNRCRLGIFGTWAQINEVLVRAIRGKHALSQEFEPNAANVDNQSVKTNERCKKRACDGGKEITERKRNIIVDELRLLLRWTTPRWQVR